MKNNTTDLIKTACLALIATALIAVPAMTRAEDSTNAPAAQTPAPKKHSNVIHGKVAAVDATAMTFTVGDSTVAVSSSTKITKNGQPAVFADITVGETVASAYKKDDAGKLNATSVRIGAKKAATTPPAAQ
jgi:hypothetical protein